MARIVLGVTGSVAAYKGAALARLLVRSGHEVRALISAGGQRFVTPLQLQALTGHPVPASSGETHAPDAMDHIRLARWGDALVVAPASADFLAKVASGIADDLLTTVTLAFNGPIYAAPAMNTRMLLNPATQANLELLRARDVHLVDSQEGDLACGEQGAGKMAEPERIAEVLLAALAAALDYSGVRALVTAGPTEEPLDRVRILTNRSSGRMGFAIARALSQRGASVRLVAGPTPLEPPDDLAEVVRVTTTAEMAEAVRERFEACDVLIMNAAVADWRPSRPDAGKPARSDGPWQVTLEPTEDILASLIPLRRGQALIGFALASGDSREVGRQKLERKGLDAIAVNDPSEEGAGPLGEENHLHVVHADGRVEEIPPQSKEKAAHRLLDAVRAYVRGPGG